MKELEIRIRSMDDESRRVSDISREINTKTGIPIKTCHAYLYAKRRGYESFRKYEISRDPIISLRKTLRREAFLEKTEIIYTPDMDQIETEDNTKKVENLDTIRTLVGVLGENQRSIIFNYYFLGKNATEIARERGHSVQNISRTQKAAIRRMRKTLLKSETKT